ncbi:hypothetical protein [Streptomyces sp. NPDC059076]|uniref:hypothetical protein n=1 Tax=unclassified Streptomyces TaxID=2593676 RepID=UPI0036C1248B
MTDTKQKRTAPPEALNIAARALHEAANLAFLHIQSGRDLVAAGAHRSWEDLEEGSKQPYRVKAQKALEADTFEEYYDWVTLIERLVDPGSLFAIRYGKSPAASADTERTRAHRAEFYLVHHLLRVDDAELLKDQHQ